MKKFNLFKKALVATIVSFSACTNETDDVLTPKSEIRLTSEITPSRVTSLDYQSTQIVAGQQVGVTITGAKSKHNNVAWSVGENGALTNTGDAVYLGNGEATITAYHPFNDAWNENTSYAFSVSTDQSSEENYRNSDLLWTTTTSSKTENAVPLTFTHKLAKINVTLVPEESGKVLNGATISICNTKISTIFNPVIGELSDVTGDSKEIKGGVTTSEAYTASAMVVPQTVNSGSQFIKIALENKTFYYTLPADKVLKSGYSHNYTLTVKEQKVEVKGESEITDWTEEEVITGDAEEEAMNAVDLGLSVKWANCNIGASSPEEYGNYYAWGETETKADYTANNSTWWNVKYVDLPLDSNGNIQSAYDASIKKWGNSWRLPTISELDELKNNCNWEWSTVNGVKGYTLTSKVNGNSIFLPSNDSSVINGKETGFGSYWSSTPWSDTNSDNYGRYAGALGFYAKDYNISEDVKIQTEYFLRWCKRGIRPVLNE